MDKSRRLCVIPEQVMDQLWGLKEQEESRTVWGSDNQVDDNSINQNGEY